ncbi:MAG: HAD-IB family hydrolase [Gammaproteobacteria bacterium]|nr:HAD-IB family hydrolase [Gammaproteobacteria bacterium]MDH3432427.1 HAD-IB family hydrolase [Gammaproteobacteria bacterium]
MLPHQDVVAEILQLPDGPQIGAFFDFDGTVISGYSAFAFIEEQVLRGHLSPRELVELFGAMASFGLGKMGFSGMMLAMSQFLRGIREDSYAAFGNELFETHIARSIYPESRALVHAHLSKGHTVAIISSATPYQVEPAARDLNIEHVLCTRLEVENGMFTGAVVRPTCFGPGKVTAAESLVAKYGVDLGKSFFYSDSDDDIALLERVGNPRPLNPNSKLLAIAERRGWPVRRFGSRGEKHISDWLRSLMVPASLVGSFVAGLPIWALTGSKRDALNFSVSLFADTASAIIGLNLKIKGEHHVWSHRPAVFIFNHQSNVDLVIVSRLLRRDITGVGKREIRDMPIIGRIMEAAGVVLIDRRNSASAIEAMTPLVDAMRVEGKSVCLSPEGTRAVTPKLAPFKKGAFHLAMQAGVPIVPIVIQNSGDVQPKGDMLYHPGTVEVEVLPPIDTSKWSRNTIEDHVTEVRNMYLRALDQEDDVKVVEITAKRLAAKPDTRSRHKNREASPASDSALSSE